MLYECMIKNYVLQVIYFWENMLLCYCFNIAEQRASDQHPKAQTKELAMRSTTLKFSLKVKEMR